MPIEPLEVQGHCRIDRGVESWRKSLGELQRRIVDTEDGEA